MPDVTIYTTAHCPYCIRTKHLLTRKHVAYREIDVTGDDAVRERMVARSGRRTVPQIFIGDKLIGGYEELAALERSGRLYDLLDGETQEGEA